MMRLPPPRGGPDRAGEAPFAPHDAPVVELTVAGNSADALKLA